MKVLPLVNPTPEQLQIIQDHRPGVTVIRGAAGSGKTTTALLRLKFLANFWRARHKRLSLQSPVRIAVLTYNRTLRGYIAELAHTQVAPGMDLIIEVNTFAKWAMQALPGSRILDDAVRVQQIISLGSHLGLPQGFLLEEVEYALGRFLPNSLGSYLTVKREGRGTSPRMDRQLRERLLNEVVQKYSAWKISHQVLDWNDLAVELGSTSGRTQYDVIIADEAQDFSANQIRALLTRLAKDHSVTFVLDAAQRIYPRFHTWKEVGVALLANNTYTLKCNHRNTVEIAAFARPLLDGLDLTDDGTLPDFSATNRHGRKPRLLYGKYSSQLNWAVAEIKKSVDLGKESVAFLHMKGGGWFRDARSAMARSSLDYVEISRSNDWPSGPANIALSTLHSRV